MINLIKQLYTAHYGGVMEARVKTKRFGNTKQSAVTILKTQYTIILKAKGWAVWGSSGFAVVGRKDVA
jgi:hypothetical protein